jgi:hypothetical protein
MPHVRPLIRRLAWGGPTFRPMRGDIDGPAVRCLLGTGRRLQAYGATRDRSVSYFMGVSPIVRSLGRQWPPIEMVCRGPRCAVQNRPHWWCDLAGIRTRKTYVDSGSATLSTAPRTQGAPVPNEANARSHPEGHSCECQRVGQWWRVPRPKGLKQQAHTATPVS